MPRNNYDGLPLSIVKNIKVHGNTWLYNAIHGNTWHYMVIHGNTWLCMAIHSNTWY